MNNSLFTTVTVLGIIEIAVALIFIIWLISSFMKKRVRQNKVDHFGDAAEKKVIDFLKSSFPRATVMESVYLRTPTGLTELDTLMICDKGLFIIEVKSHNGEINTDGKFWTQRWNGKTIRFHSPIEQNKIHKTALEKIFRKRQSLASLPVYTVTVFTSSSVSFSKNVKDVIKFSHLNQYIRTKKSDKRMTSDMIRQVEQFVSSNMETSRIKQQRHRRRIYNSNSKKREYRHNR